jgi:hypothetical protein
MGRIEQIFNAALGKPSVMIIIYTKKKSHMFLIDDDHDMRFA